ncbi:hypothetical protein CPB83DRAFT_87427 [Crepidotus variabilis]|uniref:Uncharacterized protein n=1 Tax=Crepidotus variabilis TaxID=179855 RepID=A0A9P6EME5_9AGAR|nr:hypothetical protein CPB83DRAFT_87427 [Crepidotus variabilis]
MILCHRLVQLRKLRKTGVVLDCFPPFQCFFDLYVIILILVESLAESLAEFFGKDIVGISQQTPGCMLSPLSLIIHDRRAVSHTPKPFRLWLPLKHMNEMVIYILGSLSSNNSLYNFHYRAVRLAQVG